jgi:hypothetical protein
MYDAMRKSGHCTMLPRSSRRQVVLPHAATGEYVRTGGTRLSDGAVIDECRVRRASRGCPISAIEILEA